MDEILKLFGGAENIWAAIQQNAGDVGYEATKTMLELFYVLKSPETGFLDKSLIIAALGYQLLPEDILPQDKFGLLGFLDNGVTLAFAYNRVKSSVTPEIERQVNNLLENWFGTDSQPLQQKGMATENGQGDSYIPQPLRSDPQPLTFNRPTSNDLNSRNNIKPQRPSWDDDEDVVID